jgi:hypothetical protein
MKVLSSLVRPRQLPSSLLQFLFGRSLLVEAEEGGLLLHLTLGELSLVLLFPVLLGHLVLGVVGILAAAG